MVDNMIKCAFCDEGFKPTFDGDNFVTRCSEIDHCEVKSVNGCKQCEAGWALKASATTNFTVDNTVCVQLSDDTDVTDNCLAVENTVTTGDVCVLCQKGFQLSLDNTCEQFQIQQCQSAADSVVTIA